VRVSRAGALTLCLQLCLLGGLQAQTALPPGVVLVERAQLSEANGGMLYRYQRSDRAGITLFVTPLPPSLYPCVDECVDQAVAALSEEFAQAIISDTGRHSRDSLRLAGSVAVAPPLGSWLERGQMTALRGERDGETVDSYLWLFLGRETLVQVRGAEPAGAIDFETLNGLVNAIVQELPPPYACPAGLSTAPPLVEIFPIDIGLHKLPFRVDSTLAALEYRFTYRSEASGLWRTAPRFLWPEGSALATASEEMNPGIQLVVVTAVHEGGSVVAVSSRAVCQVPERTRRTSEDILNLARKAKDEALDAILRAVGYLR
jgi:hypothetical protein